PAGSPARAGPRVHGRVCRRGAHANAGVRAAGSEQRARRRRAAPHRALLPVLRADRRATVAFTLAAGGSPPRSATRGGELDRGKAHCCGASGLSPLRRLRSLVATPAAGPVRSAAERRVETGLSS